jgi:hypothetical protein
MSDMPPYLASEISSRLLASEPAMRKFFNLDVVSMTGTERAKLCSALWLMGYGEACGDMADAPKGELPPLAEWLSNQ